jgi:TRAP-type C4-dicarboxylate transport system permease large subunit
VLYLVAVRWVVWRKPGSGPAGVRTGWPQRLKSLGEVWPIVLLFVAILGGIYMGVWTVTEAAGVGAGMALLIALLKRKLGWGSLKTALFDTAKMTAILFAVLIGADIFQRFVVRAGLPDALVGIVTGLDISPLTVVLMMIAVYVVLGCVFESLSMMLLTVPVFAPIVAQLGLFADYPPAQAQEMSLIWFGIIVVVVTEISLITPPIGLNVFVLRGVLGDITAGTIFRGVTPFWTVDIIRVLLLLALPWIALFLPMTMRPFG